MNSNHSTEFRSEFSLIHVNTDNNLGSISFLFQDEGELFLEVPWWNNRQKESENINLSEEL